MEDVVASPLHVLPEPSCSCCFAPWRLLHRSILFLQELGAAGLTKRPTSCMLILPKPPKGGEEDEEFDQAYAEAVKRVKAVQPVF